MIHSKIKQIGLYTVPSFFSKGISLILVPLYVTHLSMAEFGQLELLVVVGFFLQYLFQFGWVSSYIRFYSEPDVNSKDLNRTILIFRFTVQAVLLLTVFLIGFDNLANMLVDEQSLGLAVLWVFLLFLLREFISFYESRYRMHEQAMRFAIINLVQATLQLIAVYYLFVILGMGINGILLGQVLAVSMVLIVLVFIDNKWFFEGKFDPKLFKRCLRFGLPLVPAGVAMFLMTASDRYMLKWLVNDGEKVLELVGMYSFAYKFVALMTLTTAGFATFFGPFVYKTYLKDGARERFIFLFRLYTGGLFVAAIMLCAALPWLIWVFFPAYAAILTLVPIMLTGFIIYNIGDYFCIGIGTAERSDIRAMAGGIVAVCNIALNFFMIPLLGPLGAALATALSYAIYTIILLVNSHRLYPISYPWITWILPVFWLIIGAPIMVFMPEKSWLYAFVGICLFTGVFLRAGGFKKDWLMIKEYV